MIIRTTNLSYYYAKGSQILSDINLEVAQGAIYGFLGPNGSGKTTTLSLLLGLLESQQGTIEIFGQDLRTHRTEILRKTGTLIESPSLYGHLTARENLELYRPVYGVAKNRIEEVLRITGLTDTGSKTAKKFSLGMRQRLAIALALLPDPRLLVLDEPSNGLDPGGIIELRELIRHLNKSLGMTIIISSHLLGEVEKMVSHVGIIYKGSMLFQGQLTELHKMQQKNARLMINTSDNLRAEKLLEQTYRVEMSEGNLSLPFRSFPEVSQVNRLLSNANLDVYLLQPMVSSLEQLFIDLTRNVTTAK